MSPTQFKLLCVNEEAANLLQPPFKPSLGDHLKLKSWVTLFSKVFFWFDDYDSIVFWEVNHFFLILIVEPGTKDFSCEYIHHNKGIFGKSMRVGHLKVHDVQLVE